ncbi:MAG: hypothetical protein LJE84_00460, partial [Gammaproteobacteria bacterium]|nr:hypothetical protein [Gammaproteobacteria bacterium]
MNLPDHLRTRAGNRICLAFALFFSASSVAGDLSMDDGEAAARDRLAAALPGARLLWTRDGAIFSSDLATWRPRRLSPAGHQEGHPRWSPDGRWFVHDRDGREVWLRPADGGPGRLLIRDGHTPDFSLDGLRVTAIGTDPHQVLVHDLGSGNTRVLYDSRNPPGHGQPQAQSAELNGHFLLSFRRTPRHSSEIIDLRTGAYLGNTGMHRGDCDPAWTPDGQGVLTTARTSDRPVLRADFDPVTGTLGESRFLAGLQRGLRYYAHDARLSRSGRWLVYAGQVLLGAGMLGRHEIYL